MSRWLSLFAVLAFLASPAAAVAATDAATAKELLQDSGVSKELTRAAASVKSGLHGIVDDLPKKPTAPETERIERLIESAFAESRLRPIAEETVATEMSEAHVPALREWFATPAGKAVTKAEDSAASGTVESFGKLKKDGIVLLEQMPRARRDLLDRLVVASRATRVSTTIMISSTLAIFDAIRRANPDLPVPEESQLRAQMESARPRIEQSLYASYLESFASIYKNVGDTDLELYEKILTSAAGQHFTDVLAKAIEAAMVDGAKRMAQGIFPPGGGQTT